MHYIAKWKKYFINIDGMVLSVGRSVKMCRLILSQPRQDKQAPFPFFDLPDLAIQKILKDYVFMSIKMGPLSTIKAFRPYLDLKIVWCQRTLSVSFGTRPGTGVVSESKGSSKPAPVIVYLTA